MNNYNLNDKQLEAVNDLYGHILVIAGAGSGKTRVLTSRICKLIEDGVSPYNILAITFTNKAANEMKERISKSTFGGGDVWTSTFHSMCAKILRFDADKLGYGKDFSIYTDLESDRVVKRICAEYLESNPKMKSEYLWHISRAKTYALSPSEYYDSLKSDRVEDATVIATIYKRYEDELKKCNSMDFDDLLLKTLQLFETSPEVLEKYQNRFQYIHVDEFQDTNTLQYRLVKMLSAKHGNLFVVGDEDQSIYSWRGAEIKNILNFKKDFNDARIHKLEQNYRSTSSILEVANNVIKHNTARNEKNLWCENKNDYSVEYYEAYSDRDEANYVSRQINYLMNSGESYRDMAILVRANSLTRMFEEDFNLHGIPYKVFGGFRFFERKEIKDALAYVRIALNPSDNDSILRVINYPKRGIGNTAVLELQKLASEHNTTFFNILINPDFMSPTVAKKVAPFTEVALKLIENAKNMQPVEFMRFMLIKSGIETFMSTSTDPDDANRLENVNELVSAVQQFVNDNKDTTISDFMQSVSLVSDTDSMDEENYVTIATIHAVKGLEFDNVFIVGLEENIFPTSRALASGDIEEERRLMYVAITRAKKHLCVTNARSRYRFGETVYFPKSRFVMEMKGEHQSLKIGNSYFAGNDNERRKDFGTVAKQPYTANKSIGAIKTGNNKPVADFNKYKENTIVEHNKFGRGIITATSGDGEDKVASILFKGIGVKRFSLAIAINNLKIIEE